MELVPYKLLILAGEVQFLDKLKGVLVFATLNQPSR
jgi:hypothetical protein